MNTSPPPTTSSSDPTLSSVVVTPDSVSPQIDGRKRLIIRLAIGAVALLLVGFLWSLYSDVRSLRTETARRLQTTDATGNNLQVMVKGMQETLKDMQGKLTLLENRQAEAQSQQLALEQLYQELYKNRDDWALAEIEQVLSTASQQLQLSGNVQGALIALQNADRNLAQSDKPQFVAIRRAIASDLERLRGLPVVDLTGIALRLDSVIGQVDNLPLLAGEKPSQPIDEPKQSVRTFRQSNKESSPAAQTGNNWLTALNDNWQSFIAEISMEMRQLVRVRSVDTPDALLLSPTEAYYARENLKLRLLSARLGLVARNESAFRSDLIAAQQTITKYFDTRARQTQTVQALLKQVQNNNLSIEMPTLSESLTAVRNYKAKP